jgi:hypothetical protein
MSMAGETSIAGSDNQFNQAGSLITYEFDEKDEEYDETQLRRFETIFFISLPVGVIFSLLGVLAFRGATGVTGPFTQIEYQYVFLSAVSISASIAFHDNRVTYKKEVFD